MQTSHTFSCCRPVLTDWVVSFVPPHPPALPPLLPAPGRHLTLARLLGTPLALAGTTAGTPCAAPGELGQGEGTGGTHR